MKTNLKRSLILTCLLAAVLALPAVVQAQFNYITNADNTITITGYTGSAGDVTIPDTINGYPVTSIGAGAFANCFAVTNVAIGIVVTNIGNWAFVACPRLIVITVDTNNPSYSSANGVLFDKSQTTLVEYPGGKGGNYTIPNSVNSIENSAFADCPFLAGVAIPDSVTGIGDSAFGDDLALTNVTIGDSLTNIGVGAFGNCESLIVITVATNNPVYSSVNGVLFNKSQTGLILFPEGISGSYTIPDSVTSISDYAFDRTGLASITIPDSVTNIGHHTFGNSLSLTNVTIPDSVTSLGDAFQGCSSLTSVTIPDSVVSIGDDAFFGCYSLSSVTIPDSVTNIGDYAFSYCGLTNVTIGDGIAKIGIAAFYECEGLTSVTIGKSVTSIEYYAFYLCISLTKVTIGNSVTNIGDYAFAGCDSLTSVTIGTSVTSIERLAFENNSLTTVYFKGNAPVTYGSVFITSGGFVIATAYYLPGTTGWGDFSASTGVRAVPWNPLIQTGDARFGVRTNQFGFNINWASGQTVVVETCTNLTNPVWQPVQTNALISDSVYFNDPQSSNYHARFYRIKSP